jgi:uncharacterized iron-regulated membrane protein
MLSIATTLWPGRAFDAGDLQVHERTNNIGERRPPVTGPAATGWNRWVRQPQTLWIRRAVLQVHLWTGVGLGFYVLIISLSGSVLVFRDELNLISAPRLQEGRPAAADLPLIAWLLDLHDNLLSGSTGRRTNAIGALLTILVGFTGAIVWWPGIKNWRRSLTIDARGPWKSLNWRLHSALGFWCLPFILMWTVSGFHLSFPSPLSAAAAWLETLDESNPALYMGDKALYWLTYAHFGRFAGRIPGCGAVCGTTLKMVWALVALVPVLLFATGFLMWWNRATSQDGARDTGSQRQ